MAQDKSAEIIKFSGAAEPPEEPAPEPMESPEARDAAPSLEDLGAGAYLRAARERANLSVDAASNAIKVKAEHLEAIEWMRLDRLPALPYATGFVKAYARFLGLDPDTVAATFKADALAAAPAPVAAPTKERAEPQEERARLGWIFAMFAVILFTLWVGYQVIAGGEQKAEEAQIETRSEPQPRPRASEPEVMPAPAPEIQAPEVDGEEKLTSETAASDSEAAEAEENIPVGDARVSADASAEETAPAAEQTAPVAETAAPVERDQAGPAAPGVTEVRERPLPRRAQPAPPQRQSVIIEAVLSRPIAPDYPNRCTRGADERESVTVMFDVSAEGRPVSARIISTSNDCFNSEALRTVERWRFTPRTVDGTPALESGKTATVNFVK
ncbi:TonB family protein [Hyphococcus sp.]|uniref:TonB family protein n=1 Tax=Hyphococcus sp. TaxID=2038636 RepID=UPI003D11A6BD